MLIKREENLYRVDHAPAPAKNCYATNALRIVLR